MLVCVRAYVCVSIISARVCACVCTRMCAFVPVSVGMRMEVRVRAMVRFRFSVAVGRLTLYFYAAVVPRAFAIAVVVGAVVVALAPLRFQHAVVAADGAAAGLRGEVEACGERGGRVCVGGRGVRTHMQIVHAEDKKT